MDKLNFLTAGVPLRAEGKGYEEEQQLSEVLVSHTLSLHNAPQTHRQPENCLWVLVRF